MFLVKVNGVRHPRQADFLEQTRREYTEHHKLCGRMGPQISGNLDSGGFPTTFHFLQAMPRYYVSLFLPQSIPYLLFITEIESVIRIRHCNTYLMLISV